MKIKLIGLGKMGLNFAKNLKDHNHEVIAYDLNKMALKEARDYKIQTENNLETLFSEKEKHIVWLLIPSNFVEDMIEKLIPYLKKDDILIDAGNSKYNDSLRRYNKLKELDINFVDIGTSGGTEGARNGACLMIGGDKNIFEYLEEIYKDVSKKDGYSYMGSPGSGHFVKMVHNGIEYGMMQAIAEGFDFMNGSSFNLDFKKIASVWNNGSIIESNLLKNAENAFSKDPFLNNIEGKIDDSGEARWMLEESINKKIAMPVITSSLLTRFKSKDDLKFSEKVVAAIRNDFGGHKVYEKK